MKYNKIIMTLFFVSIAFSGMAQKGVQLKLQVGSKWYCEHKNSNIRKFEMEGDSIVIVSENTAGSTYEVLREDKGSYDIKLTFSNIKFHAQSNMEEGEVLFDSEEKEDMDGGIGVNVKKVLGKSFVFTIDGNTRKVTAIKERPIQEELAPPSGPEPNFDLFPKTDDDLHRLIKKIFGAGIPDAQLVKGLKWDSSTSVNTKGIDQKVDAVYTINRIEGGIVFIDVDSKRLANGVLDGTDLSFSAHFTTKGTTLIDQATGLLKESKTEENGIEDIKSSEGQEDQWVITNSNLFRMKKV
ncbi:hypothetical protein [Sphingobacterium lumbrici]|uniref:hypothetical protein n=1 Tax=Sphingobacterium lumbrici TaxID=2559600 RepID=UPI0011274F94|nr:hypothetical protein [Sphingobacterium lumbrici]